MALKPETAQVVVHPRRAVMHQVVSGFRTEAGKSVPVFAQRTAVGGEMIEVPLAEAAYLRAHGFLHEPTDPVLPTQTGGEPLAGNWAEQEEGPGPTINGDNGRVVRGG